MTEWYIKDIDNYHGVADGFLIDGKCPYTGMTRDDIISRGYSVINDDELAELDRQFKKSLCGDWTEIDEETYNNNLDNLPPVKWYAGGFFMPECYTHNIYSFYQKYDGKFYTSLQEITCPRSEIIKSLREFIINNERTQENT